MYIIKCIPTPKKATERNPKVMYYEDTWESGTNMYNTSKQMAKKFNTRLEAEMIATIIILAWLLLNTLATLIIICIDSGTPTRASDWVGVGLSCILSPLTILFIIQPITTMIAEFKRKKRKKLK